jgi:hypothetical protein
MSAPRQETTASCPTCHHAQSAQAVVLADWKESKCPSCERVMIAASFEPVTFTRSEVLPELMNLDGATCFHCPGQPAHHVCDGCGSYICRTCQVEWFGERVCLSCLHQRREVKPVETYKQKTILWDNLALALMLFPLLLIPVYGYCLSAIISPVAFFLLVTRAKKNRSLVPRSLFRYWAGIVMSVLLVLSFVGIIVTIIVMSMRASDGIKPYDEASREDITEMSDETITEEVVPSDEQTTPAPKEE